MVVPPVVTVGGDDADPEPALPLLLLPPLLSVWPAAALPCPAGTPAAPPPLLPPLDDGEDGGIVVAILVDGLAETEIH